MIIRSCRGLSCAIVLWMVADICRGHSIVSLIVPTIADPRDNAVLSCRYDMEKDRLFSAKWYKNDIEIFRYMPTQKPPGLPFPVDGFHLAKQPKCSQVACDLELKDVSPASVGLYKCEVSTEAPKFRIKDKSANMSVAALLRRDPLVEGAAMTYALGDEIRVNCTSDPSMPPAEVIWYINDVEATYPYTEYPAESGPDSRGLTTTSLGLRLRAVRSLFVARPGAANPTLTLKCVSTMPSWVPGGPHERRFAIAAALRVPTLFNQKLEWLGSAATLTRPTLLLPGAAAALMFLKATYHSRKALY